MAKRRVIGMRIVRDEDAPPSLFQTSDFSLDVISALDPELVTTRYNRTWRLSQPRRLDERWVWGKLGFERSQAAEETRYDEVEHDFVTAEASLERATFSHYVLDLETQNLVFETKPPDIRLTSFEGALSGILRQTFSQYRLVPELVPDIDRFEDWLESVEIVTRIRISMRRPNPGFEGRPEELRRVLEASNAAQVDLEARAVNGESLDVENSALKTYADYTGDGYGEIKATGQTAGRRRHFDSNRNLLGGDIEVTRNEGSESIVAKMRDLLTSIFT